MSRRGAAVELPAEIDSGAEEDGRGSRGVAAQSRSSRQRSSVAQMVRRRARGAAEDWRALPP
uniref:Uncharacterized protein n=1 Tax=Oryza meridionalis TaxID=40149 RepID=A0A0E0EE50_9ORYZ